MRFEQTFGRRQLIELVALQTLPCWVAVANAVDAVAVQAAIKSRLASVRGCQGGGKEDTEHYKHPMVCPLYTLGVKIYVSSCFQFPVDPDWRFPRVLGVSDQLL